MSELPVSFVPLAERHLPMLAEWLNRPHVAEWWGGSISDEEVRADFLPLIDSTAVRPYIAHMGDRPIAYVQSYVAAGSGDGWWPDERDPGVRGIDQFLADAADLGRGLGTQLVRQFVEYLFRDESVTRIQTDPAPDNPRAIRCYEKAGFRRVGVVDTPDGPALLMVTGRRDAETDERSERPR